MKAFKGASRSRKLGRRLGAALLATLFLGALMLPGLLGMGVATASASGLPGASLPNQSGHLLPPPPEGPIVPAPEPGHPAPVKVTRYGRYGLNIEKVWKDYTKGSHHVIVAYIEGGINWYLPEVKDYVDNIYVNWRELPVPCVGTTIATATMTVDGKREHCHLVYSNNEKNYELFTKGYVNVTDWKEDPRVTDRGPGGMLDPEDLIAAFSNGVDHDHDGYPNDISGWNVYRHDNDPATSDSTYNHSDDQMQKIHTVCPDCTIMPVKAGVEALDDTQRLAKAYLYAAKAGAKVIVSVTADLGHSTFQQEVLNYLRKKGILLVEATNDFDSTDHQGGMYWNHVVGGNGVVPDKKGTGWVRSDLTSWGTHAMFVVPSHGGSTSVSSPTLGASFGLLYSYAHKIGVKLTANEAIQLMRESSRPFTNTTMNWPGANAHWSLQYGYGIPDVARAIELLKEHSIPPSVEITSPSWYHLADPTKVGSVKLTGKIKAPGRQPFTWVAEAAIGAQPKPDSWFQIGSGKGKGSFSGTLGTLDLSSIPKSFWEAKFHLSTTRELNSTEEYAVTLRVVVKDQSGQVGIDRRAINVVHDPSWLPGYPIKLHSSGESQPVVADLQGTGEMDLIFGTANGYIHAIDAATGKELPGWPVHTEPVKLRVPVKGIDPGYQPILADVAVGDLFHTGNLDVVAVSLEGYVYAWNAAGQALPGWPKIMNRGVLTKFPVPRPGDPYTRLPSMCGVSAPVLAPIGGGNELDVIDAGCDGYIHVWTPKGKDLPGWPVRVHLPRGFKVKPGYHLLADHELGSTVTIVHFKGTKGLDIVERSQYTEIKAEGIEPFPYGTVFAYDAHGRPLPGWDPIVMPGLLEYYESAMWFLTEGSDEPAAFDPSLGLAQGSGVPPGQSNVLPSLKETLAETETALTHDSYLEVGPVWTTPYLYNGVAHRVATYESLLSALPLLSIVNGKSTSFPEQPLHDRFVFPFSTSGAFGRLGGKLAFVQPESGARSFAVAELHANDETGIHEYVSAYPALPKKKGGTLNPLADFPAKIQGMDLLGDPVVAPLAPGGHDAVVVGGDSNAIEAIDAQGQEVPGFPKWTTGWTLFAPTVADLLGNGRLDVVSATREGYIMAWSTNASAKGNDQWWAPHHDNWNTGLYGLVTRPPGVPRDPHWSASGRVLSFIAPGGTWYSGKVAGYRVKFLGTKKREVIKGSALAGSVQRLRVPPGTRAVWIQAENAAGLLSTPVTLRDVSVAALTGPNYTAAWILGALGFLGVAGLAFMSFLTFWRNRKAG